MSAQINLKTTGVRGGSPSWHENKGRVVTFVDGQDFIAVDAFEGFGKTYKRRAKSEIEINIGKTVWRGTKEQLARLIAPLTKEEKILEEIGHYISTDAEHYPKIVKALKKALKKSPDKMVDDVEFDAGEPIDMWQKVEYSFTVKAFCELIGIEG